MFATTTFVIILSPGQFSVAPDGTTSVQPTVYAVWRQEVVLDRPKERPFLPSDVDPKYWRLVY
jgi:hypothetical protein